MIHNKRVPELDGMSIDKAHKGGGGKGGGVLSGVGNALGIDNIADPLNIGGMTGTENIFDVAGFIGDPTGVLYTPKSDTLLEIGSSLDVGGIGSSPKYQARLQSDAEEAARLAEMEARRLAALQQPLEERAKLNYNQSSFGSGLGSLGLIVDTQTTKRSASTGLGGIDKASAGLGFGTKSKVGK